MRLGWLWRRWISVALIALLILTPVSPLGLMPAFSPVSAAKADTKEDLKNCLNIVNAAVGAAAGIAGALADPEYAACISEAAAGNVITIGMMAAVTALWVAAWMDDFGNPGECKGKVAETLLGLVAQMINSLIGAGDSLIGGMLESLFGEEGVKLLQQIAVALGAEDYKKQFTQQLIDEAKEQVQSLLDELATALGPVMHYLNCGCAAAGTAAIIKNAGEGR